MTEPRRLLDDPTELTEEERRLLLAGATAVPPSALGADVWAGLAAKLPGPGPGGGSAPGGSGAAAPGASAATPSAGVSALLLKTAAALLAVGAFVFAGRALLVREATPSAVQKRAASVASVAPSSMSAGEPGLPLAAPTVLPAAAPNHLPAPVHSSKALAARVQLAPSSSASDASEESRVVAAARDALRSGNSATALALLGQARQRFGSGVLGQEREALFVEALAKSGQRAAAHTRGEAFLENYAHSPYAARIRSLTAEH